NLGNEVYVVAPGSSPPIRLACERGVGAAVFPDGRRIACVAPEAERPGLGADEFGVRIFSDGRALVAPPVGKRPAPPAGLPPNNFGCEACEGGCARCLDTARQPRLIGFLTRRDALVFAEAHQRVPYDIDNPVLCRLFAVQAQ